MTEKIPTTMENLVLPGIDTGGRHTLIAAITATTFAEVTANLVRGYAHIFSAYIITGTIYVYIYMYIYILCT
jgi:hypothetical protein